MIRLAAFTFLLAIMLLALGAVSTYALGIRAELLTRDLASLTGVHPLTGCVSSLGILIWGAAVTLCAYAAVRHWQNRSGPRVLAYLLASAGLSLILLLDDLFMFHEELAGRYLHLDQEVVMGGLLIMGLTYLVVFRGMIFAPAWSGVAIATFVLFGCSVLLDMFESRNLLRRDWQYYFEDGFKFLGICGWAVWQLGMCLRLERFITARAFFGEQAERSSDYSREGLPMPVGANRRAS